MKIVTLTLNPAFDVHCEISDFRPGHENLARITANDAGGKGINISRALTANGVDNLAFVLLGEENGADFARALARDGIACRTLTVPGRIRENLTCHTAGQPETRISFAGFSISGAQLVQVMEQLNELVAADDIVTFTGRVPAGVDKAGVTRLLGSIRERGERLVIDSRSVDLALLRESRPWMIKPNQEEISQYLGHEVTGFDQIAAAAQQLHRDGIANVMVSLGGQGAMLVCEQGVFTAAAPEVEVCSTVGAGDSMIAGFLAGVRQGLQARECLRLAVAYGSAACMTSGTRPPEKAEIARLLPVVGVEERR